MAKVNRVKWYGHVLRRDDKRVLSWSSEGQEEARTTKEDMENASGEGEQECCLEKEDALNRARWSGEWELERLLFESGHTCLRG